jgi:hypothetical protein
MLCIELLFVVDTAQLLVAAPPFLNKQPVASLIMISCLADAMNKAHLLTGVHTTCTYICVEPDPDLDLRAT